MQPELGPFAAQCGPVSLAIQGLTVALTGALCFSSASQRVVMCIFTSSPVYFSEMSAPGQLANRNSTKGRGGARAPKR